MALVQQLRHEAVMRAGMTACCIVSHQGITHSGIINLTEQVALLHE
ncbi:MAG: hypothetical protein KME18_26610 [Phormidium tanganyikae FI6-MK23]|nr:hypothetical protein [Phormidium tanganyikae FI6-MK23]